MAALKISAYDSRCQRKVLTLTSNDKTRSHGRVRAELNSTEQFS